MSDDMNFDSSANTINISDIAIYNERNAIILSSLKEDDPSFTSLILRDFLGDADCCDYSYYHKGIRDMEWLGHYVGKNTHLEDLCFGNADNFINSKESFCRGLKSNKSVRRLAFYDSNLSEIDIFRFMGPFIKHNPSLIRVEISDCELGGGVCHSLSMALQGRTIKSLKHFTLTECHIDDGHLGEVVSSLSMHPQLEGLRLKGNGMGRIGTTALANIVLRAATVLRKVDLSNNNIDDDGVEQLALALARNGTLQNFDLSLNSLITIRGWRAISTLLEAPNSNLQELSVVRNEIDDDGAVAFASALANNCALKTLDLRSNTSITNKGWRAFSKLLCDTSSVKATYLSNHTLSSLSYPVDRHRHRMPSDLVSSLDLNRDRRKTHAAIVKILKHHVHFDMHPLFEWDFKLLPLFMKWMEAARDCPTDFDKDIRRRKLSALYQFIRAMPMMYVEACTSVI
mmetsp:Transcript_24672/g.51631  ORF Transcript_24672/g.51631 Transcript_24672/m.51631 type:complete len:456 (-) Transcript_24672:235-1602(-)